MKTKKSNRSEVRENCLNVPMNKYEKENVRKAADAMGVSMATFVRIVLADYFKEKQ
jgi:antitoxin component of RelBE/YafQ-DinJ toxin-antitoxin module